MHDAKNLAKVSAVCRFCTSLFEHRFSSFEIFFVSYFSISSHVSSFKGALCSTSLFYHHSAHFPLNHSLTVSFLHQSEACFLFAMSSSGNQEKTNEITKNC